MESKIVLAADELSIEECLELASKIGNRVYAIKIHNLYDQHGPGVVNRLHDAGATRVWVDAKLHDIPNTVKLRAKAIAQSGADIITVHASGGVEMMAAALKAQVEVYAITVLTSLKEEQINFLHGQLSEHIVPRLARLAHDARVHGVVCSPKQVGMLAQQSDLKGLKFIVPGVRSPGKATHDQQQVDTPAAAIRAGATHIVVDRQVTQAPDPIAALEEIEREIAEALASTEGVTS